MKSDNRRKDVRHAPANIILKNTVRALAGKEHSLPMRPIIVATST
jgi:hypothetical protein